MTLKNQIKPGALVNRKELVRLRVDGSIKETHYTGETIGASFASDDVVEIREWAKAHNISLSELIRAAVYSFMEEKK